MSKPVKAPEPETAQAKRKRKPELYRVNAPRASRAMDCKWILSKMQASTAETRWDLVSRVEPLFHSAWEASASASDMLGCASDLYPPRQKPRLVSDEVRLAVCDVAETALQYTDDPRPAAAIEVTRRYAQGLASVGDLDAAWAAARAAASDAAWDTANAAAGAAAWAAAWAAAKDAATDAARDAAKAAASPAASPAAWAAADARNANIVRRSLGTPGLMLLMR